MADPNPSFEALRIQELEKLLALETAARQRLEDALQGRECEVTHRRMAEETLRFCEERCRALFDDSPFPMWEEDFAQVKQFLDELKARGVTDVGAHLTQNRPDAEECVRRIRILDVNRAAREFYGAGSKEELTRDLNPLIDAAGWAAICAALGTLAAGGSLFKTEFATPALRGELRTVTMIVSLQISPGDWSRVIVCFVDITGRKREEEQFLQAQKMDSLRRLAGGIAHDFNNLLMVVTGYSELLLSDGKLSERSMIGLREIQGAGARGAELTDQLLVFSRKQVGKPRVLNLNELIGESQGMLDRVLGDDVRLYMTLEPEGAAIFADSGQMQQVLMLLAGNARDAMPHGGVLRIETANVTEAGAEYVRLRVADSGVGMDENTRQHVLEPFFTKGATKGTGLALATVYGVVTQAGGHISVTSEPGDGSVFDLFLPRLIAPGGPGAPETRTPAKRDGSTGWGTVLVVEDQADVLRLAVLILTGLGYQCLEAADGNEALAVAERFNGTIRLMLTDVIMPRMNGRQLSEQMAKLRPEMKVVFMSGYTERIMGPGGLLDSPVAYLQKPFTPEQLNAKIRQVLAPE